MSGKRIFPHFYSDDNIYSMIFDSIDPDKGDDEVRPV